MGSVAVMFFAVSLVLCVVLGVVVVADVVVIVASAVVVANVAFVVVVVLTVVDTADCLSCSRFLSWFTQPLNVLSPRAWVIIWRSPPRRPRCTRWCDHYESPKTCGSCC